MNAYERRRIAIHEAGHALIAAHEGFESIAPVRAALR
jgi:hypothetical protein